MNGDLTHPQAESGRNEGWSRKRLIFFIVLASAAHIALIFIFGTRKDVTPRPVVNVPLLQFANSSSEAMALDDPTLFALPHANDFGSPVWLPAPVIAPPSFGWTEPPRFLPLAGPLAGQKLGAVFNQFMETNRAPRLTLDFKPDPQFFAPNSADAPILAQRSTLQIIGELANRPRLNQLTLPAQPYDDVIQPSKVQVLVDPGGDVLSVVLLDSSALDSADQQALDLARTLRFAPASQLTLGEIIFNWHTVPMTATNAP
jgi:TonB family protein